MNVLTKLNGEGKVLWTKSGHSGERNNEYSIEDVIEDDSGGHFLLLSHEAGLTKLLKTDSAFSIKSSTSIHGQDAAMLSGADDGVLVLSNHYYNNSSDIVFECYGDTGDIKWRNQFGGTGDEGASWVLNVKSGYYLIGFTLNWTEAG